MTKTKNRPKVAARPRRPHHARGTRGTSPATVDAAKAAPPPSAVKTRSRSALGPSRASAPAAHSEQGADAGASPKKPVKNRGKHETGANSRRLPRRGGEGAPRRGVGAGASKGGEGGRAAHRRRRRDPACPPRITVDCGHVNPHSRKRTCSHSGVIRCWRRASDRASPHTGGTQIRSERDACRFTAG